MTDQCQIKERGSGQRLVPGQSDKPSPSCPNRGFNPVLPQATIVLLHLLLTLLKGCRWTNKYLLNQLPKPCSPVPATSNT